jgi:hypothetical protein
LPDGSSMAASLAATFPLTFGAADVIFGDGWFARGSETDEYFGVFHDRACMTPQFRIRKAFVGI